MSFCDAVECLEHPLVRDLAWCVFSPPLLAAPEGMQTDHCVPDSGDMAFLGKLDSAPGPLQDWMTQCRHTRIGLRFEHFWQFWLRHASGDCEHRFNIQVQEHGRTLGELDAVTFDRRANILLHRELAVKFYLGVDNHTLPKDFRAATAAAWVGPNVNDRLDLKFRRLLKRQMRLMDAPSAAACLPDNWSWNTLQRQMVTRGRLFYPLHGELHGLHGMELHGNHLRGIWVTPGHVAELDHDTWMILDREHWFADRRQQHDRNLLSTGRLLKRISDQFLGSRRPFQIAAMERRDQSWKEVERVFIVPDQWPATT